MNASTLPPGSIVTPAGAVISNAPPGLLQFLVGIQANESGFDYFRAQGSPGGSEYPPSSSVGGGYGAYQFQQGTSQYNDAQAAGWSPMVQDEIAAKMAIAYYNQWHDWMDVAEAWYGPATVPQNPVSPNSVQDVTNVLNEEESPGSVVPGPSGFVTSPYSSLTTTQIGSELASVPTGTLTAGDQAFLSGSGSGSPISTTSAPFGGVQNTGGSVTGNTGGFLHQLQGVLNPGTASVIKSIGFSLVTMAIARAGITLVGGTITIIGIAFLVVVGVEEGTKVTSPVINQVERVNRIISEPERRRLEGQRITIRREEEAGRRERART